MSHTTVCMCLQRKSDNQELLTPNCQIRTDLMQIMFIESDQK